MKTIIKILLTAIMVYILASILPGISVTNIFTSIAVAIVLGLLNQFVKPVIILFTLPATIFTFGLFLLVINAFVILMCEYLVKGFQVDSFGTALLFSIILSIFQSFVFSFSEKKDK